MYDISSVAFCPDELEAMLKDQNSSTLNKSSPSSLSPTSAQSQSQFSSLSNYAGLANATISTPSSTLHTPDFGLQQDYQPSSSLAFTGVPPPIKSFISPAHAHPETTKIHTTAAVIPEIQGDPTSFFSEGEYDVIWPAWPRDLPSPSIVRHL